MIDLLLIILSTYFLGKKVGEKGYETYRWRLRHVFSCIFAETFVAVISILITENIYIGGMSGIVALIGIIIFRYQKVTELVPKNNT
ncbi:hypothetical protein DBR32_07220 [Taibaiella sp. KBW10]|uniref:hypothetical protein n=1 Tax=Taibaiella sp. KBW10 TaxID=2153357 RepID=UPI000F59CE91|nr:hypothetical protein [Taibaiella sp. KBW10]RQO31729.1 hypothetical protein DBR32_07220 [Taibaiella sp. KBW10]